MSATASLVGDDFLRTFVALCATSLGFAYAYIAEVAEDPEFNRIVAFWDDGAVRSGEVYAGVDTPGFEIQHTHHTVMYPHDVAAKFPRNEWLAQNGVEAFLGVPLVSSSGELIGHFGVLDRRSITDSVSTEAVLRAVAPRVAGELERMRALRALSQREQLLRMVVEHSNDVLFRMEFKPDQHLAYISPSIERVSGHTPEEFVANRAMFFELVQPDDREDVQRAFDSRVPARVSARWGRLDGQTVWVEYSNAPTIDEDGDIASVDGVIRDITQRVSLEQSLVASEEHFRAVIRALPDMVFRIDAAGIYREYVESDDGLTYVPQEQFIGRHLGEVMPPDVAADAMRAIHAAVDSGTTQRIEYWLETAGEMRRFEARIVPRGKSEVLAFVRDLSAEHSLLAERARRVERDELEGQIESKMTQNNPYGLTFREFTVLHHIARGLADKEIAEALGISAYTVNKHVAAILSKMEVTSRTAAGVRAVRDGVL
jgi:PAS domain S-box-containing protein